jgi:hypothetical protein
VVDWWQILFVLEGTLEASVKSKKAKETHLLGM